MRRPPTERWCAVGSCLVYMPVSYVTLTIPITCRKVRVTTTYLSLSIGTVCIYLALPLQREGRKERKREMIVNNKIYFKAQLNAHPIRPFYCEGLVLDAGNILPKHTIVKMKFETIVANTFRNRLGNGPWTPSGPSPVLRCKPGAVPIAVSWLTEWWWASLRITHETPLLLTR